MYQAEFQIFHNNDYITSILHIIHIPAQGEFQLTEFTKGSALQFIDSETNSKTTEKYVEQWNFCTWGAVDICITLYGNIPCFTNKADSTIEMAMIGYIWK